MKLPALAARYAQARPNKLDVALPLLIMAALYWLSSLPGEPSTEDPAAYAVFYWISPSLQNALHVPAYACLAAAWRWALRGWLRRASASAFSACAIAAIYGVFDEWHQSFVPGRYASLTDVVSDAVGALLGVGLVALASRVAARNAGG